MSELNEAQARAVEHASGPLLVFAGAGSGKTRTIVFRIANLLVTHRVPPYRILAVTFTNKAAGEMRERLERLAGSDVTRDLWVGTFHSVCARLLRRYHEEVGLRQRFTIYDDADQKAVVARVLKELRLSEREYPPRLVLSRIHAEKQEGRGPREVDVARGFDPTLLEIYTQYQRALELASAVDFEDLILNVMKIAEDPLARAGDELRSRFQHVLVDEFQDTNAIQYRLVRALAVNHRNLCVVGDDDQSIYRWRGADVRIIRNFRRDFPDAIVVKLEQNYRSTANIVAAALGVIRSAHDREPKELWTEAGAGEKVVVRAVRDEREEAAFVVACVKSELVREIPADEIAVFYRVHAQSRVLEEAFRSANLPYQIIGGMKFFERAEVKDLLAYLRLIDNPRSDADLMRIVNVPPRGIGDKTVEGLFAIARARGQSAYEALEVAAEPDSGLPSAARKKLALFRTLIEKLRASAETLSPHELANAVLLESGYADVLREQDNAESDARIGNLAELVGSIAEYEAELATTGEQPTLAGYLERVSLVAAVDVMKGLPTVSLMTVHSAKGLEFTAVLLTGMEEEIFPYRGVESHQLEELDEERRLAYVALTRARRRLYVTHAWMRTLFGQTRYLAPSRFLADLPESAVRHEGLTRGSSVGFGAGASGFGRRRGHVEEPAHVVPGQRTVDHDAFDDVGEEGDVRVRPGDTVRHRRFGRGIVQSIEKSGAEPTIVARFPGYGTLKIRAGFLELG